MLPVKNKYLLSQKGNAGMLIIVALLVAVIMMVMLPAQYSEVQKVSGGCPIGQKPAQYEELSGLPGLPVVNVEKEEIGSLDATKTDATYVLIRRNVPIPKSSEIANRNFFAEFGEISGGANISLHGHPTRPHTVNLGELPVKKGYLAFYPTWEASMGDGGTAYFLSEKMIFFVNQNPSTIYNGPTNPIYTVDIYVQKELFDPTRDYEGELFACTPEQQAAVQTPRTNQNGTVNPNPMMASIDQDVQNIPVHGLFHLVPV